MASGTTQGHITNYQARTRRPLTAYALTGEARRVIPGGALVTITENTRHVPGEVTRTATAYMGGQPFECEITPDQYTPYNQNNQ